jgi:hypothetical protein
VKLIEWIVKFFGRVPHRIRKIRFEKRMDNLMKTADLEKK